MLVCPECGGLDINQYRMPTGTIWCVDCGFYATHKEKYNPFFREDRCEHIIVDARNEVIKSGYMCIKCNKSFASGDHDERYKI